jgi:hypothetical protein
MRIEPGTQPRYAGFGQIYAEFLSFTGKLFCDLLRRAEIENSQCFCTSQLLFSSYYYCTTGWTWNRRIFHLVRSMPYKKTLSHIQQPFMKRVTYFSHELSLCMVPELRDNTDSSSYTRFRYPRFRFLRIYFSITRRYIVMELKQRY